MDSRRNSPEAQFADRLDTALHGYDEFRRHIVPICAAETPISDYVRSFSLSDIQEKYAMGGPLSPAEGNFIGAEHVLALHQLVVDLCSQLFQSTYADPRPPTGTSAVTALLMTLSEAGQTVAVQTAASGGHPSMGPVCRRLGLNVVDVPYDFDRFNFDFAGLSRLSREHQFDFILLAPSDIIYPPAFDELALSETTTVLFDATQVLGLISAGVHPSPIRAHPRMIILGGTHKTLPGPSSGLIMTANDEIARKIDSELSPKYLRHSQPQQIASLAACLVEQLSIGRRYGLRIREFSSRLSSLLSQRGIRVLQHGDRVTETHQVFVSLADEELECAYHRFGQAGVTLNKKSKALFRGAGVRLGVQELARYQWTHGDLETLADLIADIIHERGDADAWNAVVKSLASKNLFHPEMVLSRA